MSSVSDDQLRAIAVDEGHAALARELGVRSLIVVPLVARGQTLGWISLSSATPQRYGPPELSLATELARRAASAIDNAQLYAESQQAVVAREEFLAVASHELFTPMTALGLSLQALQRKQVGDDVGRLIQLARRQGDRLRRLVSDLLDVTRLDQGKLRLDLSRVALGTIVRDVLTSFQPELAASRCEVSVRGEEITGLWDRARLEQVLTNLIANAIKFGAGQPIEVTWDETAGVARLVVTDHGIGIDPAQLPSVFDRFERAVSVQHYGGLGLGLYIARRIVEAHGGSIRAESQLGAGARFIVELPCAQ